MKYCTHCGKELLDEAVICPSCGCAVGSPTEVKPAKVGSSPHVKLAILSKVKTIFAIAVVALSVIPTLLTFFLRLNNDDVEIPLFVLQLSVGVGYITTSASMLRGQKKAGNQNDIPLWRPMEIYALPAIVIAHCLTQLIALGYRSAFSYMEMEFLFYIVGFIAILAGLLVYDIKKIVQNKIVELSFLTYIPVALAFIDVWSILIAIPISAFLLAVGALFMTIGSKKWMKNPFTKKQFLAVCISAVGVLVLFVALNVVSPIVTNSRIEQFRDGLKNKIFVIDDTDAEAVERVGRGTVVYAFDSNGQYYTYFIRMHVPDPDTGGYIDRVDGGPEEAREIRMKFDWFGFGDAFINWRDRIICNEAGAPFMIISDYYNYRYRISDSIPEKYLATSDN